MRRPADTSGKSSENPPDELLRGDFKSAALKIEERLRCNPRDFLSRYYLGLTQYKMGNFESAEKNLKCAIEIERSRYEPFYLLGLILQDCSRPEEALRAFLSALELSPSNARVLHGCGVTYFLLGNYEEALRHLLEASRMDPENTTILHNLAVAAAQVGQWQRAAQVLSRASLLAPARAPFYHQLLVEVGRQEVSRLFLQRAHRIKNLLGVSADELRTILEEEGKRLDVQLRGHFERLRQRYERLQVAFSALLRTLSTEPLDLSLADVHELLDGALLSASSALRGVKTLRCYSSDLPEIVCGSSELAEAFFNIILNAAEAMGGEGTLTISTSLNEGWIVVSFADTGCGLPPVEKEKIFQFGFSTKEFGSGVGLSQALEAVKTHGGRIELRPNHPSGAVFEILLPQEPEVDLSSSMSLRPVLLEDVQRLLIGTEEVNDLLLEG